MNTIVIGENKPECLDVLLRHMPMEMVSQCAFAFWYDDRNFTNIGPIIADRLKGRNSVLRKSNFSLMPATRIIAETCAEIGIDPSNPLNQHPLITKLYVLRHFSHLDRTGLDYILFCDDDVVFFRDVAPLFVQARETGRSYYQTERIYGRFDYSTMSLFELAMFNEIFQTKLTPEQYNIHLLNSGTLLWNCDFPDIDKYLLRLSKSKKWKWFWHNRMKNRSRVFFLEERFVNFLYHMRNVDRFSPKDVEFTNTFRFIKKKQNVPIALHYAHGDKDMPMVLTWLNSSKIEDGKLVCYLSKGEFEAYDHKLPTITKNPTKIFQTQ
jgi:hypothetical protein